MCVWGSTPLPDSVGSKGWDAGNRALGSYLSAPRVGRSHSDPAPGEAGEGTKPDPRVCQTERECETDRQASRVSALPSFRANLTRLPRCLSFHLSTPAFSFLSSALVTMPGGHCALSRLGPNTRAHTRTHTDTAELGYHLPSHFPRRYCLP